MRTIAIRLKTGDLLEYELRETDGYEHSTGGLRVQGWKVEFTETETDSGTIRSYQKETRVDVSIPADNIAYYEITI